MKKIFLSIITISAFLPLFLSAQSLDWKTSISSSVSASGPSAEFKGTAQGPDGRIYSTGYFHGFRAKIGNTVLKADSVGFKAHYSDPTFVNPPEVPTSLFVACHESNGSLAWAKTITSAPAFDVSQPGAGFFSNFLSGDKLVFDNQGNLVMAGIYMGDTLMFDGVPFNSNAPEGNKIKVVVVKIAPSGSLLWGHSEKPLSNLNTPRVKSLQIQNGTIEALVYMPDISNDESKYSLLRFSGNGARLPALSYQPQFAGGSSSWLISQSTLPDGRHLFCSYSSPLSGGDGKNVISVLHPDLSAVSHHSISFFAQGQSTNPPPTNLFSFNSIGVLPDGQISALFTVDPIAPTFPDWKLIMNTDTLDIPIQTNTRTIMVRMAEPGCMKKVALLDFSNFGENEVSPNGSWVILKNDNLIFGTDTMPEIRMVDRNGSVIHTVPLGNLGTSSSLFAEHVLNTIHTLKWQNGHVAGCFGSWLFKASLPDPVVADQSFSGCLSNRNIVLSNEKPLATNQAIRVFETEPGTWAIQSVSATSGSYQVVSPLGQTLLNGKIAEGRAHFSSKGLARGIYLLRQQGLPGEMQTVRFMVK
jgi:hypothetical protein